MNSRWPIWQNQCWCAEELPASDVLYLGCPESSPGSQSTNFRPCLVEPFATVQRGPGRAARLLGHFWGGAGRCLRATFSESAAAGPRPRPVGRPRAPPRLPAGPPGCGAGWWASPGVRGPKCHKPRRFRFGRCDGCDGQSQGAGAEQRDRGRQTPVIVTDPSRPSSVPTISRPTCRDGGPSEPSQPDEAARFQIRNPPQSASGPHRRTNGRGFLNRRSWVRVPPGAPQSKLHESPPTAAKHQKTPASEVITPVSLCVATLTTLSARGPGCSSSPWAAPLRSPLRAPSRGAAPAGRHCSRPQRS